MRSAAQIGGIEWDDKYNHLGWSDLHGFGQIFVDEVVAAPAALSIILTSIADIMGVDWGREVKNSCGEWWSRAPVIQ